MSGLFGCFYAGVVAVPVPALTPGRALRSQLDRIAGIWTAARPAVTLTTGPLASRLDSEAAGLPTGRPLALERLESGPPAAASPERAEIAVLQFTSGSTSDPKGVEVTHRNFLGNLGMLAGLVGDVDPGLDVSGARVVSWLPLFHDMGLVQALFPVFTGGSCVFLEPVTFLWRPHTWLKAISEHRAAISVAPDFAYGLCAARVRPEQCEHLDLSHWTIALNGSEPVRAETLDRFEKAFAPYGFSREAFAPVYGLAEATVFVTGLRGGGGPRSARVDRPALASGEVVDAVEETAAYRVVSCGAPPADLDVRIVDPARGTVCPPDRVGEIWVSGPSVAAGYLGRPAETEQTFRARLPGVAKDFLRTGDLGFLRDGALHVVGRLKEVIIVHGRNHHPEDLELTARHSHPALADALCAAFDAGPPGEPRVVLAAELDPEYDTEAAQREIERAVRLAVIERHELAVAELVFVDPGELPRTTSGKVRRAAAAGQFRRSFIPERPGSP